MEVIKSEYGAKVGAILFDNHLKQRQQFGSERP